MPWQKLIIEVDSGNRERVEECTIGLGALSISLEDAGDEPLLEPAPGETPMWSHTRLIALFPDNVDRSSLTSALTSVGVQVLADPRRKLHLNLVLMIPVAWLVFYAMDMIEFQALVRSLKRLATGKELKWQNWVRVGVLDDAEPRIVVRA